MSAMNDRQGCIRASADRGMAAATFEEMTICSLVLSAMLVGACAIDSVEITEVRGPGVYVLAAGDIVRLDNVELAVPEHGEGVRIALDSEDGWQQITLTHDELGVHVEREAFGETQATTTTHAVIADPCADNAYNTYHHKWQDTYGWYASKTNYDLAVDFGIVETLMKHAASNITDAHNDCGRADRVSATHSYRGRTTSTPTISTLDGAIRCSRDHKSVVGFKSLQGYKAATCWYWNASGVLVEADIAFDRGTKWVMSGSIPDDCTDAVHFESVATHEFGHAFGLLHPGTSHPSLTMQPGAACDKSKRTLGLGDMLGLESLY